MAGADFLTDTDVFSGGADFLVAVDFLALADFLAGADFPGVGAEFPTADFPGRGADFPEVGADCTAVSRSPTGAGFSTEL